MTPFLSFLVNQLDLVVALGVFIGTTRVQINTLKEELKLVREEIRDHRLRVDRLISRKVD